MGWLRLQPLRQGYEESFVKGDIFVKMRMYRFRFKHFLIVLALFLDSILSLAFAYTLSYLIDNILLDNNMGLFPYWIVGTVIVTVLCCLSNIFINRFLPLKELLKASIAISRDSLLDLLHLNYKNYSKNDKGYYYNVVTNSSFTYAEITINLYTWWTANIIIVLAVIGVIFYINPIIGGLFALYVPITALASIKPSKISSDYNKRGLPTQDVYLNETRRIIESKREINISKTEKYFYSRYKKSSGAFLNFITKYRFYEILSTEIPIVINKFYSILILSASAILCFHGKMSVGSMLFMYQVLNYVSNPIAAIFETPIRKKANSVNIKRVEDINDQAKELSGFENLRNTDDLVDAASFSLYRDDQERDLLFSTDKLYIKNNSFTVVKGANGSGKSMLINYLTGNIPPDFGTGNIRISRSIDNSSFLTYPTLIVEGSFEDNMLGITPDPDIARILSIDFEDKFIKCNPINLSYGQQQKLNLLRVLSSPFDYLFLDEPMTNLDEETQHRLFEYLVGLKGSKTIVIITHDNVFDAVADDIITISNYSIATGQGSETVV